MKQVCAFVVASLGLLVACNSTVGTTGGNGNGAGAGAPLGGAAARESDIMINATDATGASGGPSGDPNQVVLTISTGQDTCVYPYSTTIETPEGGCAGFDELVVGFPVGFPLAWLTAGKTIDLTKGAIFRRGTAQATIPADGCGSTLAYTPIPAGSQLVFDSVSGTNARGHLIIAGGSDLTSTFNGAIFDVSLCATLAGK